MTTKQVSMSIPDGEYDIDLSVLNNDTNSGAFALRYGFVPESMDQDKPLTLYDDGQKNLILQATDTNNDDMIFEGINQLHNNSNKTPQVGAYYLTLADGRVKLDRLNNTIRVNKSRNSIKWKNMIKKWRSEIESRNIISESDFEDLDEVPEFSMQFEDTEMDFERIDEEKERELKKKEAKIEKEKEKIEQEKREQEQKEKEQKEKEQKEKEQKEKERKEKERKEKEQIHNDQTEKEQLHPSVSGKKVSGKKVSGKNVSGKSVGRKNVSGKNVSGKNISSKSETPSDDDDFEDLENQLEGALYSDSDASDSGYIGEPIKIIDSGANNSKAGNQQTKGTSNTSKRPTSLRALMGDKRDDDFSSSEEE